MKKIFGFNIAILFSLIIFFLLLLKILNFFVSGPPRYHELVYSLEKGDIQNKKEKLVYYKKSKNKIINNFYKFNSSKYKSYKYSGPLKNALCGSMESGISELIYATDKNGFRENLDILYEKSDFVLLGDSFTMSICENKPHDLKSHLNSISHKKTYLNLGMHGTDYVKQLSILLNQTKKVEFDTLIWFFYEGNDYEDSLARLDDYNNEKQKKNFKLLNLDDYVIKREYKISSLYKFRVWLAEYLNGLSSLLKYFKNYNVLLNDNEYNQALNIANNYLSKKNINSKFIYYIPSWQRLTNYKSKRSNLYNSNPQIKQLNLLKETVKKNAIKNGFIFIDGEDIFMKQKNPLSVFHYELNSHFNSLGYKLLATDIFNKIVYEN
jgi:hypothetical protein